MTILLGAILRLDFNSVSQGRCRETIFAAGTTPAHVLDAVHQRLMVGHTLKRNQVENILVLKDTGDKAEVRVELAGIEVLPLLECQLNPLYNSFRSAVYVLSDSYQFNARTFKKISGLGAYKTVLEKLEELQSKLNTEPEWQALAG